MGLYVDLGITSGSGLAPIGMLEILRQEKLQKPENANDEVHNYVANLFEDDKLVATGQFQHRYGDRAWVCVQKALSAVQ